MLLDKYQHTFHPNHYILLEMKQALIGLYVRMPPTVRNLSTKIKLCEEVFDVVSKLEHGISRTKGDYSSHSALPIVWTLMSKTSLYYNFGYESKKINI